MNYVDRVKVTEALTWRNGLKGEGEAAGVEVSEVEMAMGAGGWVGKECPHHDLVRCHSPPEALGSQQC